MRSTLLFLSALVAAAAAVKSPVFGREYDYHHNDKSAIKNDWLVWPEAPPSDLAEGMKAAWASAQTEFEKTVSTREKVLEAALKAIPARKAKGKTISWTSVSSPYDDALKTAICSALGTWCTAQAQELKTKLSLKFDIATQKLIPYDPPGTPTTMVAECKDTMEEAIWCPPERCTDAQPFENYCGGN